MFTSNPISSHPLRDLVCSLLVGSLMSIPVMAQTKKKGEDEKAVKQESEKSDDQSKPSPSTKQKPKQVKIGGIQWYVDYDAALKIAQKENKPLWVHFGENPG